MKKEPMQKTPNSAEIPIPTRGEFMRNLTQIPGKKLISIPKPAPFGYALGRIPAGNYGWIELEQLEGFSARLLRAKRSLMDRELVTMDDLEFKISGGIPQLPRLEFVTHLALR